MPNESGNITDDLLTKLVQGSDDQVDPALKEQLQALIGQEPEVQKRGLHKALDYAARYSWCSGFTIHVMDLAWKGVGGELTDPAPWQAELEDK
jgi:hypothetical protein